MTVVRWGNLRLGPAALAKIEAQLASPRTRGTAVRIMQRTAQQVADECKLLAEEELHRRPDHRRSEESLAHGAEYHDSFVIVPARDTGYDKLRVGVTNTHPAAKILELGADEHVIRARAGGPDLNFPWIGYPVGRGGPGAKNPFAVVASGQTGEMTRRRVNHPGVGPRRILSRSLRRYRRRANKVLNPGSRY